MAATKPKDAIALLKQDHDAVQKLFKEFESAKGDGRKEKLARKICLELTVHTKIEEEIFYPACKGKVKEDLLKEAYVEHDAAKLLIAEIEAGNGESDDFFDAKVKVLSEEVDHHIKEEEGELFPQVRPDAIAEYDAAGALQRRYVFDPTTGQPVIWYEGSGVLPANRRYLSEDERGSVISVSDSNGASLGINTYD